MILGLLRDWYTWNRLGKIYKSLEVDTNRFVKLLIVWIVLCDFWWRWLILFSLLYKLSILVFYTFCLCGFLYSFLMIKRIFILIWCIRLGYNLLYSPISWGSNHPILYDFEDSRISRQPLWSTTSWDTIVCKNSVRLMVFGWLVGWCFAHL